jgi:hypothetical protein
MNRQQLHRGRPRTAPRRHVLQSRSGIHCEQLCHHGSGGANGSSTPSRILGDLTFGRDECRRWLALLDLLSASQQEHYRRLSCCERYRGIFGIQSQGNRSIYRQFDVGTFRDECIANSLCGAKVSEPNCRACRCLRCAGTEQAEAFPAFAGPRPCCLLQSTVPNCSRWANK